MKLAFLKLNLRPLGRRKIKVFQTFVKAENLMTLEDNLGRYNEVRDISGHIT